MKLNWTTFMGKVVTEETIDHQHLSNIIWYYRIGGMKLSKGVSETLDHILSNRFNFQILLYRPHLDFKEEIQFLKDNSLLKKTSADGALCECYDIWFEGQLIGEIRTPFFHSI